MTIQRQTNPSSSNHSYDQRTALDWLAPRWRRDIAQAPTAWQAETIRRAQQLAAERPGSYLARHFEALYGKGGDA